MIQSIRNQFAQLETQYISPLDHRRALGLLLLAALGVLFGALSLIWSMLASAEQFTLEISSILPTAASFVIAFLVYRFLFSGRLVWATWIFIGLVLLFVMSSRLDSLSGARSIALLLPVIAAAIFLERRGLLIVTGILIIGIVYAAFNQRQTATHTFINPSTQVAQDLVVVLVALGLGLFFLLLYSGLSESMARDALNRVERLAFFQQYREDLVEAVDEDAMLVRTWDVLTDKMRLYNFMQVHLTDVEGRLNTYSRTGMGTRFAARRTDLPADNMVRVVNRQGKTSVVTYENSIEERGHLLPSVEYAIVLPITAEGHILGVLDVQSSQTVNPFTPAEVMILEMIASELGQSLYRYRETSRWEIALTEAQQINQRLEEQAVKLRQQLDETLGSDWITYLQSRGLSAFGFDLGGMEKTLTPASGLPEHLKPAMARGEMVIEKKQNEQVVTIPIKQRDEVLGAMSFGLPLNQKLTDRQIEMAHNVANRLGIALENARLVEQSQAQALRERKTSQVASVLLGQQEVRALLDTAAESFNDALGAIFTRIHIDPDALLSRTQNEEVL